MIRCRDEPHKLSVRPEIEKTKDIMNGEVDGAEDKDIEDFWNGLGDDEAAMIKEAPCRPSVKEVEEHRQRTFRLGAGANSA